MEDAHSAVIGIPDQKENVSWFAGGTKTSISKWTLISNFCNAQIFCSVLLLLKTT